MIQITKDICFVHGRFVGPNCPAYDQWINTGQVGVLSCLGKQKQELINLGMGLTERERQYCVISNEYLVHLEKRVN